MLSVSVSAFLWVLPITAVAFNRISPTVILVSLLCEPFVSALLVCSLLCSVLFICPFISFFAYPFGLVSGLCSKAILWLVSTFSQLPFALLVCVDRCQRTSRNWRIVCNKSKILCQNFCFGINFSPRNRSVAQCAFNSR